MTFQIILFQSPMPSSAPSYLHLKSFSLAQIDDSWVLRNLQYTLMQIKSRKPPSPCFPSPWSSLPLDFAAHLCFLSPQVEEELLEQEFLERCFQEMLEEEDQDWFIPSRDLNNQGMGQLQQQLNSLSVSDHHNLEEVAVSHRCV